MLNCFEFLVAHDGCGLVQEHLSLQFGEAMNDVHRNAFNWTVSLMFQMLSAQN